MMLVWIEIRYAIPDGDIVPSKQRGKGKLHFVEAGKTYHLHIKGLDTVPAEIIIDDFGRTVTLKPLVDGIPIFAWKPWLGRGWGWIKLTTYSSAFVNYKMH